MADVRVRVELEPALGRREEIAARDRNTSVRAWIEQAVRRELERESVNADPFSRLSVPAFARDWDSEEDAVYDELDR